MVISWGAIGGTFIAPYVYGLFCRGPTRSGPSRAVERSGHRHVLYILWGEPGVPMAGAAA